MSHRCATSIGVLAVVIALVSLAPRVSGQNQPAKTNTWKTPRTPDGQPDLQGVWNYASGTPLERPEAFAGRPFLKDDEVAEAEKQLQERGKAQTTLVTLDTDHVFSTARIALARRVIHWLAEGM